MTITTQIMEECLRQIALEFAQIGVTAQPQGSVHGECKLTGGTYATVVGVSGDLVGAIALVYDDRAAQVVYGAVKFDPETELDEWTESALKEVGNILGGRICMFLERFGLNISLLPPTSVRGETLQLVMPGKMHVTMRVSIGGGTALLHLALANR